MKRWSYATAIMLSLAGGTIMTGCIDNDEPYGIEQIRLATADFLKSKKAAVEAEAAAANAQVEIEKIKAETEKLKIEADAAIKAAQAKILEAQANKEQAQADQIKAATEAYIASQKAAVDEFIAQAEIRVKDAELKYQQALYDFEQQKIKDAELQNDLLYAAVSGAFQTYLDAIQEWNVANYNYLNAQKEYAASLVDLEWVEEKEGDKVVGGHFESPVYKQKSLLEKNVADAQAGVERAQAKIDLNNKAIADVEANDLYQVLENYKAQKAANTEAIEKVKVDIAAVKMDNAALYEKQANLKAQIEEANTTPIAIAPYTYKPDANLSIPGFKDEIPVVGENVTYTLADNDNYINTQTTYDWMIKSMTAALMDENDKAWTQAKINEMSRELEGANTVYATDKANWEIAKKAYNMGNTPDASVLPLESEVEDAVKAYNEGSSQYAALRQTVLDAYDAYVAAYKAQQAALEAFEGSETTAQAKYNAAVAEANAAHIAADEKYETTIAAAKDAYDQAVANADESIRNANRAEFRADQELQQALQQNDNDAEAEAVKTAQAKYDKAVIDRKAAEAAARTKKGEASVALTKANNEAAATKLAAYHTADEKLDKAHADYVAALGANGDVTKDPAYAPVAAANKAYAEAYDAYVEALDKAYDNDNSVKNHVWGLYYQLVITTNQQASKINELGGVNWSVENITDLQEALSNYMYNVDLRNLEFPKAEAPVYVQKDNVYVNAYNFLISTSQAAYGNLGVDYDKDGYFTLKNENAFLIDNVTVETVNEYISKKYPNLKPYLYFSVYKTLFGSYGATLYLENRIEVAKAYLANTDIINEVTKTLQENLDALNNNYNDAEAAVKKLVEEKNAVDEKIEDLTKVLDKKHADLVSLGGTLSRIIGTIERGIAKIEFPEKKGEALESIINDLKEETEKYEGYLTNWNKELEKAQYQLDQYNNGYTDIENPLKIKVDYFKTLLDQAQAQVDFDKARLDELQAKYEAANPKK